MASRARQFATLAHSTATATVRARQFATIVHARVTALSSPIQARQFSTIIHARVIPAVRVLEIGPVSLLSNPNLVFED